ncbi:MAG: DUF3313 family protein [Campylobacteraceae bacterium]|nr:DUF3313 family protein [Campylobacteraceae bacterium]
MKKLLSTSLFTVAISFLFIACANQPTTSTIISDTSMLKASPFKDGAHYYLKKGVNFKNYNNIEIPAIPIIKSDKKDASLDEALLNSISVYFRKSLLSELNSVVSKNSKQGTLTIEVSVTSLGKEFKDLKFYQYIPVGLALTALKRGAGFEDKNLVIGIALKVTDTKTKEVLAMVVDTDIKEGIKSDQKIKLSDVTPSLDKWVKHYKIKLQELLDNKHSNL